MSLTVKHGIDFATYGGWVAVVTGWLPHITALLIAVWWLIRISETKRFEQLVRWVKRRARPK